MQALRSLFSSTHDLPAVSGHETRTMLHCTFSQTLEPCYKQYLQQPEVLGHVVRQLVSLRDQPSQCHATSPLLLGIYGTVLLSFALLLQ